MMGCPVLVCIPESMLVSHVHHLHQITPPQSLIFSLANHNLQQVHFG
ncbi:hypothetical protein L798_01779 [Zootermopsis nevadensis]|uniref:Uncharacterized protein n=1 Tax=Zootermopsis nevadensis TaxID=136037 RepID=A0A067QIH4_ZOONE|nr:hypothetical protein L798_01779 [Zootermopsis nevadensis]